MAEFSKTYLRGLIIPDKAVTGYWAAETTATQESPRAGTPATQGETEAVLTATGNQTDDTDGQQLDLLTQLGGFAGADKGSFVWRHTATSAESYRGWDIPMAISYWRNVEYENTAAKNMALQGVNFTNADGSDNMYVIDTTFKSTVDHVSYRKFTAAAGWGSQTSITSETKFTNGDGTALHKYGCLVALPSGRLQAFFMFYDTLYSTATVQMFYSDDEAVTWSLGSSACVPDIDVSATSSSSYKGVPIRVRVSYKDGQHLLLLHFKDTNQTFPDVIYQYASDDMGATFTEVTTTFDGATAAKAGGWPDITTAGGKFIVTWINRANGKISVQRLGSAFEALDPGTSELSPSGVVANVAANSMTEAELAICTDEDGVVYLYSIVTPNTSPTGVMYRSTDAGASFGTTLNQVGFFQAASLMGAPWWAPDMGATGSLSDIRPTEFCAIPHRGQVIICHGYQDGESGTTTGENSFCVMHLGGYSSVTLPSLKMIQSATYRAAWQSTYLPWALPGNFDTFTKTTTGGTEAISTSEGALEIDTTPTASTRLYYTASLTSGTGTNEVDFNEGIIGQFTAKLASGRFSVLPQIHETGPNSVAVYVYITTAGVHVSTVAGAVLGEVLFTATDKKIQVIWGIKGGESAGTFGAWYRVIDDDNNHDREWTLVYQGAVVFGSASATFVRFGDPLATAVCDAFCYGFQFCYGRNTTTPVLAMVGRQWAGGQTNPDDLFGRNYSGTPLFFTKNTRVTMTDGPSFEKDNWLVDIRWLYALNNTLPTIAPSPSQGWRSNNKVNGSFIAWQRNPDATDAYTGSGLYAIHLEKVNFKSATVTVKSGGSWAAAGTLTLSKAINFTRKGNTVKATGTTGGQTMAWVGFNELKGCTFEDAAGVTAKISHNTEGFTFQNEGGKAAVIYLDPDTYTQGGLGTSGVGGVWYSRGSHIFELADMDFEGVRLEPSPSGVTLPYEAYHEIGQAVFGSVSVFGMDYSRERMLTNTANTELTTMRDGSRHSYKAGSSRRQVRFSWAEGVDVTQARTEYTSGTSAEPTTVKFIQSSGADVANRFDTPLAMFTLVDYLDGPGLPLVYLPYIETQASAGSVSYVVSRAKGAIYGRLMSPVTIEQAVGSEEVSEVFRVNSITIEEEL